MALKRISDIDRFWKHVEKGPDTDCWVWKSGINTNGYGLFHIGSRSNHTNRSIGAHRFIYQHVHKVILKPNEFVCHNCPGGDNPRCVNWHHLFLGTHQDNMRDCAEKGGMVKGKAHHFSVNPACRPFGERNGAHVLTEEKVREIKSTYAFGKITHAELGNQFNCSKHTITAILQGKIWAWVK